ncbi:MAG: DNA-binding protein [Candidatus Aminicenantes bacterium]|nr:MAG: DNA-binding protein [Candidatus Aminicenantes bacterium]RPJ03114.1 MAG: DNA-binding protein [Candidatus Aminicenantes bacterium]
MKYFVLGSTYVVRLDAGEWIVETLKSLCARDAIGGGFFDGLGAVGEAEIGHFDPDSKDYTWVRLSGPYEIVSLYGNIATFDGKPFIHAHIALGDNTFAVRGGHLREAVVSVTCEITLTRFRDDIGREKDAASGLLRLALEPGED